VAAALWKFSIVDFGIKIWMRERGDEKGKRGRTDGKNFRWLRE